jgi:peptidoglycan/xylan/chitin deacetylase (PgdA/CDA1 family)
MKHLITALLLSSLMLTAQAQSHFNVLVYHHVSESSPASTSVSPEQFREHLSFFKDNNYPVVALDEALNTLAAGNELPKNAIAITFDDAYRSIYLNAFPLLKEYKVPFTVFAATDPIDQNFNDMLSWDQLREMKAWGAIIANHTKDHSYLVRHRSLDALWQQETKSNIEHAQQRLIEELGDDVPKWLAYPYGEFSQSLQSLLADMHYIGFAQHSGGITALSHQQALPRFAAAGIYANTKTLATKIESIPMPINEASLADMLTSENQPVLQATIDDMSDMSRVLNCFVDGRWHEVKWTGKQSFELVSDQPLSAGRHRYNCTAKSKTVNTYYWFSKPWLIQ